jgi:hypothetical protein
MFYQTRAKECAQLHFYYVEAVTISDEGRKEQQDHFRAGCQTPILSAYLDADEHPLLLCWKHHLDPIFDMH